MSRPTLRQRLFGLREKDLSALNLTAERAIDIARSEAERQDVPMAEEAIAGAGVHGGRITWLVQSPGIWKGPATLVRIDDGTGAVLKIWRRPR